LSGSQSQIDFLDLVRTESTREKEEGRLRFRKRPPFRWR